jgi:hypothetical protein
MVMATINKMISPIRIFDNQYPQNIGNTGFMRHFLYPSFCLHEMKKGF